MPSSNPPTGSVESIVSRASVSLPTLWKVVWSVTSVLAALILTLLGMLYQGAKSEWIALRADVRLLQQQVAAQPTADQFKELAHDVDQIEQRMTAIERIVYDGNR
jgi:type VI protein secretion system component VasK